ncbi:uncharacterized protein LOC117007300 [Catharus ustulatus]|uniref:uncharacterized protein LOC117007300 n=1 Tax=Catharus ustulatus TaxID=91951 RepID=UPI00140E35FB|nr:uncharacterized protein LOC117007300 [Catharus ustulatus]
MSARAERIKALGERNCRDFGVTLSPQLVQVSRSRSRASPAPGDAPVHLRLFLWPPRLLQDEEEEGRGGRGAGDGGVRSSPRLSPPVPSCPLLSLGMSPRGCHPGATVTLPGPCQHREFPPGQQFPAEGPENSKKEARPCPCRSQSCRVCPCLLPSPWDNPWHFQKLGICSCFRNSFHLGIFHSVLQNRPRDAGADKSRGYQRQWGEHPAIPEDFSLLWSSQISFGMQECVRSFPARIRLEFLKSPWIPSAPGRSLNL